MTTIRRLTQIGFFLLFIILLIQTEYKGSDQLGTPVRLFLGLDPLISAAVLAAARGMLLYITGAGIGIGLVYLVAWIGPKLLKEQWPAAADVVLRRYLPLAITLGLFTWAMFPFGIDRGFAWVMALGIITVMVTLLLGRVFCGWVCPMGATSQFFGWLKREKRQVLIQKNQYHRSQELKYYLLFAMLAAAVIGYQIVGIMDPISLVIRGYGLVVSPVVNMAANSAYDLAYATDNDTVIATADKLYKTIAYPNLLSYHQPHFLGLFFVALMFLGAIGLSWLRPRFWCRVLCPLGALLGVISRNAPYKLRMTRQACHGCGACSKNCQGACDPEFKDGWRPAECHVCFACVDSCPSGALTFSFTETKAEKQGLPNPRIGLDLGKRRALLAAASALVAVPVLRAAAEYKRDEVGGATTGPAINNPQLIRPPGALPEPEFMQRCIRCGECMKVCPTNGLHPTTMEAGPEGMWTPILVPQIGYCEYYCTLCGQVCPTGAIKELDVATKTRTSIGTAFFDVDRCLPYAFGIDCIVCEEHCPTAPKAIWFETVPRLEREETEGAGVDAYGDSSGGYWSSATEFEDEAQQPDAETDDRISFEDDAAGADAAYGTDLYGGDTGTESDTLRRPRIDLELCIGCGICEKVCVVSDLPAVRITSVGEDRSNTNAILFRESY